MLKTFRTLRCFTHDDYGDLSKELFNELWVLYSSRYDFYGKWIFGTGCVFHRVVLGPATWNGDVIHLLLRWPRPRLRPRSYILTKYTRRNSRWIGLIFWVPNNLLPLRGSPLAAHGVDWFGHRALRPFLRPYFSWACPPVDPTHITPRYNR